MTTLIICASVLPSVSWLACIILALHLREAKVSLIYRNIENTVLVQQLNESIERARKDERVLEAWAKRNGKEPAGQHHRKETVMITRAIVETLCYVVTIASAVVGIILSLTIQALACISCAVAWPFGGAQRVWGFFGNLHAKVLCGLAGGVVP